MLHDRSEFPGHWLNICRKPGSRTLELHSRQRNLRWEWGKRSWTWKPLPGLYSSHLKTRMILDTSKGTTSPDAVPVYPWEGLCRRKTKSRQEKYFRVLKGVPHQQVIGEQTSGQGRKLRLSSLCILGLPWWLRQWKTCLQCWRLRFNPWSGRSPGGGHGNSKPVSLPGESHGQRSLAGYSPCGCKESDTFMVHLRNPEQEFHKKTETDSQT